MPPQRVPLMIKLPWSMDVPNLQIPGGWLFPLIVIYVGSHCCPTLGQFETPEMGCREKLHHPAGCSFNLLYEAPATSHIHLVPFTNWQQDKENEFLNCARVFLIVGIDLAATLGSLICIWLRLDVNLTFEAKTDLLVDGHGVCACVAAHERERRPQHKAKVLSLKEIVILEGDYMYKNNK